jgi:hypothetical protein
LMADYFTVGLGARNPKRDRWLMWREPHA